MQTGGAVFLALAAALNGGLPNPFASASGYPVRGDESLMAKKQHVLNNRAYHFTYFRRVMSYLLAGCKLQGTTAAPVQSVLRSD